MSKMSEMHQAIEELRSAAAGINAVAGWLFQQFSDDGESEHSPAKFEAKPQLKLEDVRAALADISRAGHTAEIRALLKRHGATQLSAVDPAESADLLLEAQSIGNEVDADG